jgi:phospholipid/cholesterol/gamma-HCH transport system substrate-binding protein
MKIRLTNEAKTGAVVLICVIALGLLILKVGNFTLLQKGWTVKSRFHFTAGVKKHAPVRLSGVDVGEVKDLQMVYGDETIIEMTLWIQDGVKMRTDSTAFVTTLGMMGEKYIEIKAGTTQAEWAKDGDLINGTDPVRLEDLIAMGTKIGDSIDKMAKDISRLANNVDRTVEENRSKIDSIFGNLEVTSANFRDFSQDIKFHPWKILMKGRERSKEELQKDNDKQVELIKEAKKSNFGPAKKEAA